MAIRYVLSLEDTKRPRNIGNKAKKLRFLIKKGFHTPTTYVCTWDAYLRYLEDDADIVEVMKSELSRIDLSKHYAIRSSANIEMGASFKATYTPQVIAQAIGVSLFLGTVGGLYPAWYASRLRPVEALRYE